MAKKQIYIKKAFKLNRGEDKPLMHFREGLHTVDEEIANHWWVKIHTGEEPEMEPEEDTVEEQGEEESTDKAPVRRRRRGSN